MNNLKQAKQIAAQPYTLVVFRNLTTDGNDYVFLASNPEIKNCKAQGKTMEEAQRNLDEVRIDMIEHLLDHNLPIPSPAFAMAQMTNPEEPSPPIFRPKHQDQPEASLIT